MDKISKTHLDLHYCQKYTTAINFQDNNSLHLYIHVVDLQRFNMSGLKSAPLVKSFFLAINISKIFMEVHYVH